MTTDPELNDPAAELAFLIEQDRRGRLAGCGESLAQYRRRLDAARDAEARLDSELAKGSVELLPGIEVGSEDAIVPEQKELAASRTERLFGFDASERPGFFARKSVGFLWGGCSLSDPENGLTVFLLRRVFKDRARWLIYDRDEILAHEQCHAVRDVLNDTTLEEFFAYRTSKSGLRRYLGNCFIGAYDGIFMLAGLFLLLLAETLGVFGIVRLPLTPFVVLALMFPMWALIRNQYSRWIFFRAAAKLQKDRIAVYPALFRMTFDEIKTVGKARSAGEFLRTMAAEELRFRVILARFAPDQSSTFNAP